METSRMLDKAQYGTGEPALKSESQPDLARTEGGGGSEDVGGLGPSPSLGRKVGSKLGASDNGFSDIECPEPGSGLGAGPNLRGARLRYKEFTSMSGMREQRFNHLRPVRYSVRARCQIVRERDFQLVADEIENLSTWGMLVGPADPVLTGERVFVSFQLPGGFGWFDAIARVTRVLHGRRPGETARRLGLEFEDLRPYDRYRLRQALAGVPPVPLCSRKGRRREGFQLTQLFAA